MPELERSPADLLATWGKHAADVEIVAAPAGLGLLELKLPTGVIYALDRSGPFAFRRGPGRVLLQVTVETVQLAPDEPQEEETLASSGVSSVNGRGLVLEVAKNFVVVRAGAPILLGVLDDSWREVQVGRTVIFKSLEVIHAFAVDTSLVARM